MAKYRDKLNDKQRVFVDALLRHAGTSGRIKLAAEEAGYSYAYARQVVTKPNIVEALEQRRDDIDRESLYSLTSLRLDLIELKCRCMQEIPILDKQGNPTGYYRLLNTVGALSALDKLGKMLGAFKGPKSATTQAAQDTGIIDIEILFSRELDNEG